MELKYQLNVDDLQELITPEAGVCVSIFLRFDDLAPERHWDQLSIHLRRAARIVRQTTSSQDIEVQTADVRALLPAMPTALAILASGNKQILIPLAHPVVDGIHVREGRFELHPIIVSSTSSQLGQVIVLHKHQTRILDITQSALRDLKLDAAYRSVDAFGEAGSLEGASQSPSHGDKAYQADEAGSDWLDDSVKNYLTVLARRLHERADMRCNVVLVGAESVCRHFIQCFPSPARIVGIISEASASMSDEALEKTVRATFREAAEARIREELKRENAFKGRHSPWVAKGSHAVRQAVAAGNVQTLFFFPVGRFLSYGSDADVAIRSLADDVEECLQLVLSQAGAVRSLPQHECEEIARAVIGLDAEQQSRGHRHAIIARKRWAF